MFVNPNAESQANQGILNEKKKRDSKLEKNEKLKRIAARNGMSPSQTKKVQDLHDKFYEV
jgi:hypothetical protein